MTLPFSPLIQSGLINRALPRLLPAGGAAPPSSPGPSVPGGAPPAPSMPAGSNQIGLLGTLFGGGRAGLLSPQEQQGAGRQALLNASLGLLGASGGAPGQAAPNVFQAIAAGAQAGQQSFAGAVDQVMGERRGARVRQAAVDGLSTQELEGLLAEGIASGDVATVQTVGALLGRRQSADTASKIDRIIETPEGQIGIDAQGNILAKFPSRPERPGSQPARVFKTIEDPNDPTKQVIGVWDPESQTFLPTGARPGQKEGADDATGVEAKTAALAEVALASDAALDDLFTPTVFAEMMNRMPFGLGNFFIDRENQEFFANAENFGNSWLRFTSGAAVPETEVERIKVAALARPGDAEDVLRLKAELRQIMIRSMVRAAGPAFNDEDRARFANAVARDDRVADLVNQIEGTVDAVSTRTDADGDPDTPF